TARAPRRCRHSWNWSKPWPATDGAGRIGTKKTRQPGLPGFDAGERPRGRCRPFDAGLLAGLGGALDGFLGLRLDLGAGRLDLGLGDLGDGLVGLDGAADHFLAGADGALDVLARDLHALRPSGLQAVEIAGFGHLAPEGERGIGVFFE